MSDLTDKEKRKLERLLGMEGGYVLDFTDRTFSEFFHEHSGRDIGQTQCRIGSGSKANRLRGFWNVEPNHVVGNVLEALIEHGLEYHRIRDDISFVGDCRRIVTRLTQGSPVSELDAISATINERDFEVVAKQIREVIERNEPEAGLDRLHTFVFKYVRNLCADRGIVLTRDKALHSAFGEYVKRLRDEGHIESEMTIRIVKSSISIFEAFNDVRNSQSLAHDNKILNYDESLLIFNHVASTIRFLKSLELRMKNRIKNGASPSSFDDDIPF